MPLLTTKDRLGTTIAGKYRLDGVLGEGGMGVVYAGHHLKLDLPVAVKFLHAQYSQSQELVDRFLREARATSRLAHPNVVQVRDVDVAEDDGSVYMVLELLKGESLAQLLERERALSVEQTMPILLPVIDALQAAHDLGIIHRDIKPDNVFLSQGPDGRITPKVLDFGIAKLVGANSPSATATGAVMGTALYMAPEQAMGQANEIGPCSDVWATAVMAYECLTGGFPFDFQLNREMNAMHVLMATLTSPLVPLVAKRPELSALSEVLVRALDRDPSSRTGSMRELGEGLRQAASEVGAADKAARIVSRPAPATRAATGPLEEQPPVAAAPPPSEAEPRDDASGEVELQGGPATPSSDAPPKAALQTGDLTPPTRSLAPFAIAAAVVGALVIGGVALGSRLGASEPVPTAAPPTEPAAAPPPEPAAAPPSAVAAEPVAPTPPSAEAAVEPAPAPATAPEDGAERRAAPRPRARSEEPRGAAQAEPADVTAASTGTPEPRPRATANDTTGAGSPGGAGSTRGSGTNHRAGGLSAGEF